jgi:hypothetical protein
MVLAFLVAWLAVRCRILSEDREILAAEVVRLDGLLKPRKAPRKSGRRSYQERLMQEIDEMVAKVQGGW